MLKRGNLLAGVALRGGPRPWRSYEGRIAIHPSMRPPEPADIDFTQINLKYPLKIDVSNITKKGWSEVPLSRPELPFHIERSSVGASIPVYTEFKAGRTKVLTILRKCGGDINQLKEEMEKVCGAQVMVRPGKLIVTGNYSMRLKKWLIGLGF